MPARPRQAARCRGESPRLSLALGLAPPRSKEHTRLSCPHLNAVSGRILDVWDNIDWHLSSPHIARQKMMRGLCWNDDLVGREKWVSWPPFTFATVLKRFYLFPGWVIHSSTSPATSLLFYLYRSKHQAGQVTRSRSSIDQSRTALLFRIHYLTASANGPRLSASSDPTSAPAIIRARPAAS